MLRDSRGEDESAADDGYDPVTVHQSPGAISEERLARAGVERIEERERSEVLGLGERGPEAKVLNEEVLVEPLSVSTARSDLAATEGKASAFGSDPGGMFGCWMETCGCGHIPRDRR